MNGTGHFYLQILQIASDKPAAHNLQIVDKIKLVWTDCGADKPVMCNPKAPKKPGLSSGHSRQKSFHGITSYLTAWQKELSVKGCMILKTPKDNLFNRLIWTKQNIGAWTVATAFQKHQGQVVDRTGIPWESQSSMQEKKVMFESTDAWQ